MRFNIFYLFFFCFLNTITFSQDYKLTGNISENQNGRGLSYANIRIENSTMGTAANIEGNYELKLRKGEYTLITTYIGFKSDTCQITISKDSVHNVKLHPVEIEISEITVKADANPAYYIIMEAIKTKNRVKKKINNYKYSSYTKGLVKTTKDLEAGSISLSVDDTAKLRITSILESESRGFFKAPDKKKYYIVARKQSANTPPFINILTGGSLMQNFNEDDMIFLGKEIPSPISDEALSYYYYYIEKEIAIDDQKVYQIYFNTDNPAAPGFFGRLFIVDSTYHLLKADVELNQMANPGGLFNYVKVYQQFSIFKGDIALPIDYRLFVEGNYLGLAKFGFELNTIMNSYEINTVIDDEYFDSAIISVLPEADKKDENYWNSIQSIPNTSEEKKAYARIDSLTRASETFGQDISFLSPTLSMSKHLSITGPLSLYSFNKVEGSTLNFGIFYNDAENKRITTDIQTSYGFADKIFKKQINLNYLLGDYRTSCISFSAFDKVIDLYNTSDNYNKFTSTILSLFTKYDFRDYFYTKGYNIDFNSEITPVIKLGVGYLSRVDKSAINTSDYSFFYNDRKYSANESVYDTKIKGMNFSFDLDFRKYIEDGFFRRRITPRNNIMFGGTAFLSNKDLLNSQTDFSIYRFNTNGSFITAGNWSMDFAINHLFSDGTVPYQWLYALPGNISSSGKNNSFRTLRIGEVLGDQVTTIFLKHNFLDDLFKMMQIPGLADMSLQLSIYLNIAMSDISEESKSILSKEVKTFSKPFYELGFSIGHILIPLNFEFTWKLSHRGKNNFVFGINTFAL